MREKQSRRPFSHIYIPHCDAQTLQHMILFALTLSPSQLRVMHVKDASLHISVLRHHLSAIHGRPNPTAHDIIRFGPSHPSDFKMRHAS